MLISIAQSIEGPANLSAGVLQLPVGLSTECFMTNAMCKYRAVKQNPKIINRTFDSKNTDDFLAFDFSGTYGI